MTMNKARENELLTSLTEAIETWMECEGSNELSFDCDDVSYLDAQAALSVLLASDAAYTAGTEEEA